MEVVMKGSEEDCQLVTTEISILDHDSDEAVFITCFPPVQLTLLWGKFSMLVPQDSLAMVWIQMEDKSKSFKVVVKIKASARNQ